MCKGSLDVNVATSLRLSSVCMDGNVSPNHYAPSVSYDVCIVVNSFLTGLVEQSAGNHSCVSSTVVRHCFFLFFSLYKVPSAVYNAYSVKQNLLPSFFQFVQHKL